MEVNSGMKLKLTGPRQFLLLNLVLLWLPLPISMQIGEPANNLISYSVTLYLMIGIAGFFFTVTLICCFVEIIICFCHCRKKKMKISANNQKKTTTGLHNVPSNQSLKLESFLEGSEWSNSSSQSSLSRFSGKQDPVFSNPTATDILAEKVPEADKMAELDYEYDLEYSPRDLLVPPDDEEEEYFEIPEKKFGFSNRTALEIAESTDSSGDQEPVVITTSFNNMSLAGKFTGSASQRSTDSPLLKYSPRGSLIPPGEVKVPFSEPESLDSTHKKEDIKKESIFKRLSPFHKRRRKFKGSPKKSPSSKPNPRKKIISSGPSSQNEFPSSELKPQKEVPPSEPSKSEECVHDYNSKSTDPQKEIPSIHHHEIHVEYVESKFERENQLGGSDKKEVASPIRSRPKPKHPIPSRSPFLKPPVSNFREGKQDTSSSGSRKATPLPSNSILTVGTLYKELEAVSKKWYIIGLNLNNFPKSQLNMILNENKNIQDKCLFIMCKTWINFHEEPSWVDVVEALRSDLVREKDLAASLELRYCSLERVNSRTWL